MMAPIIDHNWQQQAELLIQDRYDSELLVLVG
jgi:hypothetical protein